MKNRQINFPDEGTGVWIDDREVLSNSVVLIGTTRLGYVTVRALTRISGEVGARTVAILRGRRQLLDLAKAILARDAADGRRLAARSAPKRLSPKPKQRHKAGGGR